MEPKIFRSPTLGWGIQRYGIFCLEKFNFWHFEGKFVLVIEECVVVFFVAVYLFLLRTGEWEKSNLFLEKKYIFDEKKNRKSAKVPVSQGELPPSWKSGIHNFTGKKMHPVYVIFFQKCGRKNLQRWVWDRRPTFPGKKYESFGGLSKNNTQPPKSLWRIPGGEGQRFIFK